VLQVSLHDDAICFLPCPTQSPNQLVFTAGGELFEYILARRYLKEKDAKRLFAQLMSGVRYMHEKHIVHRDLKLVRNFGNETLVRCAARHRRPVVHALPN
jgi:serine/threonine protein kinase